MKDMKVNWITPKEISENGVEHYAPESINRQEVRYKTKMAIAAWVLPARFLFPQTSFCLILMIIFLEQCLKNNWQLQAVGGDNVSRHYR